MAPTLGLIEEKDVSAVVATAESSQQLQMSSANRGNRVHDGTTLPREQQTEHDSVSPSQENLQAGGEEQSFVASTSRNTISAQARQAAAAPERTQRLQPVINNSPHPSILDHLVREQDEQAAYFYDQFQKTLLAQIRMSKEHQAARAESRSEMEKVFDRLRKSDERAQVSDAKAQQTLSEVEKMREELKKREEESKKREDELMELNRKREEDLKELTRKREEESKKRDEEIKELSRKVEETVRVGIQAAVDEERKITLKAIKKETKKEARREKAKEEKKAGKPRKNWSYYNIHVREERLRLKASGSKEDLFLVASLSWKEMDEEEREERYGGVFKLDKERYEREMEEWWEKAKVPVDQRKPAAKPTSVDNAATADPEESVAHSPPEESAAAAAAGASDEVSLSSYEQRRLDKIARNNERLRSLGLLSPNGIEAQGNGGVLSRAAVEGSNTAGIDRPEEPSQPPHEESVAVAVAENCPRVVDTPPVSSVVIHGRQDQEAHGGSVRTDETSLVIALPEAAEEPAQGKEAEFASPPDVNANHHRDSAEDLVGAPRRVQESTASLPGNVQELPSATPRRRRGRKRKNHSPYWYGNAPVYELEGYTDGTPLPAGYVWVEYESGVAVQVQEIALTKKLPPRTRNSSRQLRHNLFTASSTSRQAGDSSAQPTSLPETNHANCSRGSNDVSEVPFPVGYKFYHNVLGGIYHRGYRCVAEVKEVIGDNDGNFASPGSARRCCYYDLDDGSLIGGGKLLVKTIEKKKVYKN